MVRRVVATVTAAALMLLSGPAIAQTVEGGIALFTPFPGLVVEGGSTASFTLQASGPVGSRAELGVSGLPDGWEATFRSGGSTVGEVAITTADTPQEVTLEVTVPETAEEGTYDFEVSGATARLPLSVTVQAGVAGEVTLTPDFPGLRGPADNDFTFNVTLSNDTASAVELELAATGPEGWQVTAEPSGQSQASAITVEAGDTTTVNLTATPPVGAEAGDYEISMSATGEGVDASLAVVVQLTGDLSLAVSTPDQRLNAEVTIGQTTDFPILVINDGTAPLVGVEVTSRAPTDWEIALDRETIDVIAPGESATVTATITPAANALAGDYDLSFTATSETVTDSVSIRTTVNPSAFWGIVGVALIALTLAGLALVFRRFGRR